MPPGDHRFEVPEDMVPTSHTPEFTERTVPTSFARKRAPATAIEALLEARPASWNSAT